jgi:hypothetical protein
MRSISFVLVLNMKKNIPNFINTGQHSTEEFHLYHCESLLIQILNHLFPILDIIV